MRVLKISSDTNTSINLSSPSYLKKKENGPPASQSTRTNHTILVHETSGYFHPTAKKTQRINH